MPDIIITPSSGKLEFVDNSAQVTRRHSFTLDANNGVNFDAPLSAAAVIAPLNVINVTVDNSNNNYPFILASGSAGTGTKTLMMDGAGGTYNPFTNLATIDISGNAATATNSTQLNGQAASYYTDIPSRLGYTPVNKAGDTVSGNLTVNGNFAVNGSITAFSASNIYITSSNLTVTDNILLMNALSPYQRYAGIQMYDSGSGTISQFLWDGEGDYFFLTGSAVNGKIITGPDGQTNLTANYIPKATAGYKLGNSLIYDTGTSIGINTSSPGGKFDVAYSGGTSNFGNTAGGNNFLWTRSSGGSISLFAGGATGIVSTSDIRFYTNQTYGSENFAVSAIITTTGKVGIGTTVPTSSLHIKPQALGADLLILERYASQAKLVYAYEYAADGYLEVRNGSDAIVSKISGYVSTATYFQSNVGIGTSSPSYKLDVGAAGNDVVSVRLTPGYERVRYYGFDLLGYNDGNLWMIGNNPTNTLVLGKTWDWDNQIGIAYTPGTVGNSGGILQIGQISKNNANYTHGITRLYTNGLERITIIANGNVGISTTLPTTPLHVVGVISGSSFSGAGTGLTGTASGLSIGGSAASCTGNAATATILQTARNIGGVSFNGSADINLPGVNTAGNQNTSGNAATATNVTWTGITQSTRTNYDLTFQPPTSGYAGFTFNTTGGTAGSAGYLLVRGTSDTDVYTAEGITLVADAGWLTLAQRTTASRGVRLMTGTTSLERLKITTAGDFQIVNGNSFTYNNNVVLHAGNYTSYPDATKLPLAGGTMTGVLTTYTPTSQTTFTNLSAFNAGVNVGERSIPANTGSFVPGFGQTTVITGFGYRSHMILGSYRTAGANWAGGPFIAWGGNDNNPTEYWLFNQGGSITHSSGITFLNTNSTLTAGNLSGTIPSGVLGNSTHYVGTTAIALNRGSASQTLTGVSIDGNAATVGTLSINTSGRNDVANQIVRTDSNGYIQAGWINTTSGDQGTAAIDRVYASYDGYIRYYSPTNFRTVLDVPTRGGSGASGTWSISVTGTAASETLGTVTGRGGSTSTQIVVATAAGQAMYIGRQAGAGYSYGSAGIFTALSDNPNGGSNIFYQGYISSSASTPGGILTYSVRADGQIYTTMNTATGIANNSFNVAKTILGTIHIANGSGTSGNNNQAAITFQGGSSTEAQAGIYVSNNSSTGTAMGFATTDSYATGPQLFMTATNAGVVNFSRARPTYAGNALVDVAGGQTIAGITYFSNGESINAYGIRGRFTNEYLHLYNKVGVGHPGGWGQGEGNTPSQGLSTYGGISIAYGTNAASTFYGNVGLGTTTTTAKLHIVAGNQHIEGSVSGSLAINSGLFAMQIGPAQTRATSTGTYYPGIAFNHLLNFSSTTYNIAPQAWIGTRLQDTAGSERDYLVFATKPGTGVTGTGNDIPIERMCIDYSGNVGIGTTVPSYKLHVTGDIYANGGYLRVSGTNGLYFESYGGGFYMQDTTWIRTINDKNIWVASGLLGGQGGLTIGYGGASPTSLGAIISGSVGIGTSSPATKLDVYGPVSIRGTTVLTTNFDLNAGNAADIYGNIRVLRGASLNDGMFIGYGGAGGPIRFYSNSGTTEFMQIATSGNVGIGSTSPAALLNIRASVPTGTGTVTTGTNVLIDSNTNNYITFRNTADNGTYAGLIFLDNNVGGYIAFGNAGAAVGSDSMIYGAYQDHIFQNNYVNETLYNRTETMRIKQSGNVGIGSNNPQCKLDVAGTIRSTSTEIFGFGASDNVSIRAASTSNVMGLYTSNAEKVRIDSSGNVGIGTSNPGRKLDVEGIVRTRGASGTGGFEISAATTGTAKWRIEWDSASDSLDFNWVG